MNSLSPLRRRLGETLAIVLSASSIAMFPAVPAAATGIEPHATAVLATTPSYDGVTAAWPGDKDKDPSHAAAEVSGSSCWGMSQDPLNRYLYVDVATSAKPSGSQYANVTVRYFDAAATTMRIEYDSSASRFQASPPLTLDGTGTWRTHTFQLNAIRFLNGTNNADFRVNVSPANGTMPSVCFSDVAVTFSDVPQLSLMNKSLLLRTDEARLDVGTLASAVDYTITADDGTPLTSGTIAPDSSGHAQIDVSELGPGYYGITFLGEALGETLERSTSFGIITPTPEGALQPSSFFGISSHFGHYGTAEDGLMESLADIGYGHIRGDVNWELIEKTPGTYSFDTYAFHRKSAQALDLGMQPMGVVAYRNANYDGGVTPSTSEGLAGFGRFAAATTTEYAPEIVDYNIYNEFNGRGFNDGACGITASCYLELLEAAYEPMHAANDDVNVMGPITAGIDSAWLEEFFAGGGVDHIDTFAANVYGYALHGQNTPPEKTLLVSAVPDLVDRVDAEDGDRDIPFWITESGWPTHEIGSTLDEQAEDLVRASILAMDAGVDVYTWYSALDDGTDPNEREHNFGIFGRPDAASTGVVPKPAAVASAVLIRQVTGKVIEPREDLGDDGVYSYPFTGQGSTTRVMWAPDTAASVLVKASGPITVTDVHGGNTTFTPPATGTTVELDGEPLYIAGPVASVTAVDGPHVTVAPTSITGSVVTTAVTIPRDAVDGPHRGLRLVADGADPVRFDSAKGVLSASIDLPATQETGTRIARASVTMDHPGRGSTTIALLRARTTTVEPFTATVQPRIPVTEAGRQYVIDLSVTNNDDKPAAPGAVDYRIGGHEGSVDAADPIAPGATETFRLDAGDPQIYVPQSYRIVLGEAAAVTLSGNATFSPIEREGSGAVTAIDLDALGSWVSGKGGRSSTADVGGEFTVTHDDDGLVLKAVITDEVHHGARDAANLWQTDSIQFAVYDRSPAATGGQSVEIGAALLEEGAVVQTFIAPSEQKAGPTPGASADIDRDEAAGTTHYLVRLPWSALGFSEAPSEPFAMSFLVNDDDAGAAEADSRDGFLQWGSGIGTTPKNPNLFRDAQLMG